MFLERIGHGIINLFGGSKEPDKFQQSQINSAILDAECLLLLNAIGIYGPVEIEYLYANMQRIKNEMQKRNLSELRISGQYVIKLNIDRINIIRG